jgi:hypothetical protein
MDLKTLQCKIIVGTTWKDLYVVLGLNLPKYENETGHISKLSAKMDIHIPFRGVVLPPRVAFP